MRGQLDRITADKVHWHEESKSLRERLLEVERENDDMREERRQMRHEIEALTDETDILKGKDSVKYRRWLNERQPSEKRTQK